MNLQEITEKIRRFRDERDWAQFHSPKDMAMALSIEAAEYPTEKVRGSSLKYNEYCD